MYKDAIDKFFDKNTDKMLADTSALVAIRSVREAPLPGKPFGEGPAKALERALEMGRDMGFITRNVDNYAGVIETEGEPVLAILAHLDVVEEGKGWHTDPYKAELKHGRLYGRGTSDDKGPAMAALYAMAAARQIAPDLKGVRLVLGCAEETGSECMAYYVQKEPLPKMVFTPDADFPVINIEKGGFSPHFGAAWEESPALPRVLSAKGGKTVNIVPSHADAVLEGLSAKQVEKAAKAVKTGAKFTINEENGIVTVALDGKGAHASKPDDGLNAQTALLALLNALPLADGPAKKALEALGRLFPHGDNHGEALGIRMADDLSGDLTLAFSVLDMDVRGFAACFDSRVPLCGNEHNVAGPVKRAFTEAGFEISRGGTMRPPHHTPAEGKFVQTLLRVYEQYTGRKGRCIAIGGGTYVHEVEGGVAYGCTMPGTDTNLHGADEFMPVDELVLSAKIFTEVILQLCLNDEEK